MAWLGRFDDFDCDASNQHNMSNVKPRSRYQGNSSYQQNNAAPKSNGAYSQICDISTSMNHVSIVGVIISKDGPKSIISRKGAGNERHLLAYTVRDSETAFINVTCWGGEQYIKILASELQIGDVVGIKGAQVQSKSNNPADDKYKPWTPSPCQLTTGENQGTIVPYSGLDIDNYTYLLQMPTRPSNDFYTLEDIETNGMNLQGEHINILAVVKKIWPTRTITTKTGKTTTKTDVVLCDETCMSFSLTLWDNFATLAEQWQPMDTVIFAADVKITFNDYRSTMVASTDSKTIFTVNPETPEAACIKEYSKTQVSFLPSNNSSSNFMDDGKDPPVESISNIVTIKEVQSVADSGEPTFGVLFAFLSNFDIDGSEKSFLREICSACRKFVQEETGFVCGNPNCTGGDLSLDGMPHVEYSLCVGLADHTGSLDVCYVGPEIVTELVGANAQEFRQMSSHERTGIKWGILFERMKAVVKVTGPSTGRQRCKVLALSKADLQEFMA